jgi:hypothetical protein
VVLNSHSRGRGRGAREVSDVVTEQGTHRPADRGAAISAKAVEAVEHAWSMSRWWSWVRASRVVARARFLRNCFEMLPRALWEAASASVKSPIRSRTTAVMAVSSAGP